MSQQHSPGARVTAAEVFDAAIQIDRAARASFIEARCAGDVALRSEVESLLAHFEAAGDFLETSALPVPALGRPGAAGAGPGGLLEPGTRVGRYRILSVLGEGGMGVVYRAEQDQPTREVALKVLRPGYLSPSLLRRFEHESQALGRLQHPGIAQVYEAGTADLGPGGAQPYFAMELVRGTSLVQYAHERNLGTRQRLELVARIGDAVHHAHQRGLIHRDLKPGNILVDDAGQPKILDFGIARSTNADIAVTTARTDAGQLVGTLAYMSPEQVAADPDELDTRSDVYALGVILYELLTGRLPYDVRRKSVPEAARIIRDEEPSRLSSISRTFRGDVETIVGKALDKDKARRYQSAAELSADIRRHLADEPIIARPPSARYQLAKFARRNRALVGAAAGVFLALVAGIVSVSLSLARTLEAERVAQDHLEEARIEAARSERVREFLRSILTAASPFTAQGRELTVREILDEASARAEQELRDMPEVGAEVHGTIGSTYLILSLYEPAELHLTLAVDCAVRAFGEPSLEASDHLSVLASLKTQTGRHEEGLALCQRAMRVDPALLEANPETHADILNEMGESLDALGRKAEAVETWRAALARLQTTKDQKDPQSLTLMNNLATTLTELGQIEEAEPMLRHVAQTRRELYGELDPAYLVSLSNLAVLERRLGNLEASGELYKQVLDLRIRTLGPNHTDTGNAWNNYGTLLRQKGDREGATEAYREALRVYRDKFPGGHVRVFMTVQNLASLLQEMGHFAEAERLFAEALEASASMGGQAPMELSSVRLNYASLLVQVGRAREAVPLLEEAVALRRDAAGESHPSYAAVLTDLSAAQLRAGEVERAIETATRAVELCRALPPGQAPLATALRRQGEALVEAGRAADAEPLLREGVARVRERPTGYTPVQTGLPMSLGACLSVLGQHEEALALLDEAMAARAEEYGPEHPYVLEAGVLRARALARAGRVEEARAEAQRLLGPVESSLGGVHPLVVECRSILGEGGTGGAAASPGG